jgi:hypothetical protein
VTTTPATPATLADLTAALMTAPLEPAALTTAAENLVRMAECVWLRARGLLDDALSMEDGGSPYLHNIYDHVDAVQAALAAAKVAVDSRREEAGRIAEGLAQHCDQVFPGAISPERAVQDHALAAAWIAAAHALRVAAEDLRRL